MTWYTKNVRKMVSVGAEEGKTSSPLLGYLTLAAVAIPVGYYIEVSSNKVVADRKKRWYDEQRAGEIAYINKFATRAR